MKADEGFNHRFTAPGIEREALPLPVHGIPKPAQLADDAATAFGFPGPAALEEAITAQLLLAAALRLELLFQDRLHGDRGVIRPRQAEHVFPLQPLKAHDRVDQSRVEGMAHVQAAGHIRRWDHHREGLPGGVRGGVKGTGALPPQLPARLRGLGVVGLGQFAHSSSTFARGHGRKGVINPSAKGSPPGPQAVANGPVLRPPKPRAPPDQGPPRPPAAATAAPGPGA